MGLYGSWQWKEIHFTTAHWQCAQAQNNFARLKVKHQTRKRIVYVWECVQINVHTADLLTRSLKHFDLSEFSGTTHELQLWFDKK